MISTVIVYFNEKDSIADCLMGIKNFSDEIVIINIGNKNDLSDLKFPNLKIIVGKYNEYVEPIRNFAISYAKGDWILVLDPDERITEKLAHILKEKISQKESVAFNIPRKNIFFGRWISHSNFWPDRQIRFFKKNKVLWGDLIHSYPKVDGEIFELPADPNAAIIHYGYRSCTDFIKRQNRYSKVEVSERQKKGEKFSLYSLFWKPLREFLVRFIKHKGFLDGYDGLFIVSVLMFYRFKTELRMLRVNP